MGTISQERPRILKEQLREARESLALSLEDVSALTGISLEALIEWEDEGKASQPTVRELWQLAELYGRGTDYFLTVTPQRPRQINFRLPKWRSMAELPLAAKQALVQFEELCRIATHLQNLAGEQRLIRLSPKTEEDDPLTLAQLERKRLGLDSRPVKNLRDRLSDQGVWVFEIPVPGDEFSGFSWWHSSYGPCILVNARDVPGRRAFTLSHEYAHLLHGSGPSICQLWIDVPEERFADRFAAAFLMPDVDVNRVFREKQLSADSINVGQVASLAGRYGSSFEAMVRRLAELRLIMPEKRDALLEEGEPSRQFQRRPRTPTWRRRLGEGYVTLATQAYGGGRLSIGKLAEYLQIDIRKARDLIAQEHLPSSARSNG